MLGQIIFIFLVKRLYHLFTQKPDDYQVQYENRTSSENYYVNTHADAAYDAMWALAFALNRTAAMIDSGDINETGCGGKFDGALVSLHLFNYSNALLGCVIKWSLLQTNFIGVSVSRDLIYFFFIQSQLQ